jgi:cytochrome b561
MRWKNGTNHWGLVARSLHWGMAAMILLEVPAGFIMTRTYRSRDPIGMAWHYWASNIHHTTGMLILALALLRGIWRLAGPVPVPLGKPSMLERVVAKTTHWLLYALLILIPLSGWAALSSLADSAAFGRTVLWFFGRNGFDTVIPRIVPPLPWDSDHFLNFVLFARSHTWLLIFGAVLLTVHIAAALRHHILKRDATLHRMVRASDV